MKYIYVLFCLFFAICGQSFVMMHASHTLIVKIQPVRNDKGTVHVLVENAQEKKVTSKSIKATKGLMSVQFDDLEVGQYAVTILHDENDNQKMDTGMFGIPKEGWACSNDARGIMSAPKFKDKLLLLQENKTISVKMVYY